MLMPYEDSDEHAQWEEDQRRVIRDENIHENTPDPSL